MCLVLPALVISHYSLLTEVDEAAIPVHHACCITPHVLHEQSYLTVPMILLCVLANSLTDESAEAQDTSEAFLFTFVMVQIHAVGDLKQLSATEGKTAAVHHCGERSWDLMRSKVNE